MKRVIKTEARGLAEAIKFDFIKTDSSKVQTSFVLQGNQNIISDYKNQFFPNVSFDVNREYTNTNDESTYITVDVFKKTIKQTENKKKQTDKQIGKLQLRLKPFEKEKSSFSCDDKSSLIVLNAIRKRI
ncbi:unnamed protein product [Brachionus calyciflorus]|uniref:Uncharacterized protein n=1 Tax=Brachionus calyciflorus TaxID=104777 RepID=A0A814CRJ2_9BILA|nr:unnamed protein product [Brachionus calyciflorus]